jgi:hypothetical protein
MALTDSSFFHLGTIGELFDSYLNDTNPESVQLRDSLVFTPFKLAKNANASSLNGVVMDSRIGVKCKLNKKSIVEYCFLDDEIELELGEFSYLSNCAIKSGELSGTTSKIIVPNDICMHTIPVRAANTTKFVTIFFDRHDDLKKDYPSLKMLTFLNVKCGFLD